jgi:outer membrane protein TolC
MYNPSRVRLLSFILCVSASSPLRADAGTAQPDQAAPASQTPSAPPPANAPAMPRVTLQAALSEALQREVRVRIAGAEVARARALIAAARANFLPTLIGHGSYVRLDHQRGPSGPSLVAARDQLLADVTLTVPIFAPHAWNDTGFAADQARVAELDRVDTRRTVAIATAQAYLTVMAQHRALEVTQRALDNANAHYQYAHQRFTGGIGNQVDDVRAGQEVATSTADLEHVRAALYQAQEALAYLLGRNGPVDVVEEFTLPAAPPADEGLREALSRRSDVAADAEALKAQQNLNDGNWAEFAPILAAQAAPFYHEPGTVVQPHTGWQIQLLLTVPFYDGGARYSVIDQRRAQLDERRTQLDATMRKAKSEVRVAFDAARHADSSLLSAKQAAEFAAQALKFATLAYEAGASTNIEVVDAERRARDADTAVVIAEDAARQARLDLLAATGRFPER